MTRMSLLIWIFLLAFSPDSLPAQQRTPDKPDSMVLADRQKKRNDDAAQLAEFARQLHQALEKMQKGELSVVVMKQAAQLEKLAKSVQEHAREAGHSD